jgi:hypothetical protein
MNLSGRVVLVWKTLYFFTTRLVGGESKVVAPRLLLDEEAVTAETRAEDLLLAKATEKEEAVVVVADIVARWRNCPSKNKLFFIVIEQEERLNGFCFRCLLACSL